MLSLNSACLILIIIACLATSGIAIHNKAQIVYNEIVKGPLTKHYCLIDVKSLRTLMLDAEGNYSPINISNGINLKVTEKTKNWVKVSTESGRVGYVTINDVKKNKTFNKNLYFCWSH